MTQEVFFTHFAKILAVDCAKGNPMNLSRTLTDREAEIFAGHLWELFETQAAIAFDETWLCHALLRTAGKFLSEQDRAAAIVGLKK